MPFYFEVNSLISILKAENFVTQWKPTFSKLPIQDNLQKYYSVQVPNKQSLRQMLKNNVLKCHQLEKTKSAQVENRIEMGSLQWPTVFGTQNEIREKSLAAVRRKYIFCPCNICCTDDGTFHLTSLNSFCFLFYEEAMVVPPSMCVLVRTVYRIFVPKVNFCTQSGTKLLLCFPAQFAHFSNLKSSNQFGFSSLKRWFAHMFYASSHL